MKPVVLATLPLPEPFAETIGKIATLIVVGHIPSGEEWNSIINRYRPIVICPQLRDNIDDNIVSLASPELRAICIYAVGYNSINTEACNRFKVAIGNTPEVLTDATADLAIALMLAVGRRVCEGDRVVRKREFRGWEPEYMLGQDMSGAKLGIIGYGRIGQAVAQRALGFNMEVLVYKRDKKLPEQSNKIKIRQVDLNTLYQSCDYISLHVPLNDSTYHLINNAALKQMKSTAILVNTSRGSVIDERALIDALKNNKIYGAGLDVYENEPDINPALLECRNVVLLPHIGSATISTRRAMAKITAENVILALSGKTPKYCVNPSVWDHELPNLID